jgi:site-specific DNA-methyltransferase (adenine-specific)
VPDPTFTYPPGNEIDPAVPIGRIVADARETLARIPDGEAGLIITDPPWDIHGSGIFDACASYDRLSIETIAAILADGRRALKRGAHLYVFATAGPEIVRVVTSFERYGWKFLRLLAWDKCVHSGMGAYRNAWEPVLVFANGAPKRRFSKHQTYASILRARSIGKRTAKPYELYEVFIEMSSQPGELVVDPFCGTNPLPTAIARVQPPRRWLAGDVLSPEQVAFQLKNRTRSGGNWRDQLAQQSAEQPVRDGDVDRDVDNLAVQVPDAGREDARPEGQVETHQSNEPPPLEGASEEVRKSD